MFNLRIENVSRRRFLQSAAGLTLAVYFRPTVADMPSDANARQGRISKKGSFEPNAFLRIDTDGTVTVISKHLEMGQGVYTGLATIVAEELDAAWSQVRIEGAPADVRRYAHTARTGFQMTGGSSSIANSWEQLRHAGAAARAMLVAAAAQRWNVAESEITVNDGVVAHAPSQQRAGFGELTAAAAELPVPAKVTLRDPKDFKLIGKHVPRKDVADKTNGTALFTCDISLPNMLTALVAHAPRFGATVKSFDGAKTKLVKGVVDVVQIPSGVAVLAKDTWSAKKGRDALHVEWDESAAFTLSSEQIFAQYREYASTPGAQARKDGDPDTVFAQAARVLRAEYYFPYLAHASMEPMNCVVQLNRDGCEIWNGVQSHTVDQSKVAALLGIDPAQVKIHMLYAGGGFGRRANKDSDYVLEAVNIAKAIDGRAPVKLIWLREDDTRAGYYRPAFYHVIEAALDAQQKLVGWRHRLVGQSILLGMGQPFEAGIKNGVDRVSVEGAANLPYAIPNVLVDLHTPENINVPVLWWRAVGSTHTAYSTEAFIDEVAVATGQDPVTFRLNLLDGRSREAGVLKLVAEKAEWNSPLAQGAPGSKRGRGVAVHKSFNTYVAQVAEVTVKADGSIAVDRVVCAVDCGIAINPDNVRAQVEGSIGFALSAALRNAITLKDGIVEQSNFHDYEPLRMSEMPKVEVLIVPSAEAPTGIGEPALPPLAPAVANAIAAATGKRVYHLPINAERNKA